MAYQHNKDFMELGPQSESSLLDLLDRLLDHGVVIVGDVRLSVAGVDLLFVGLKTIICSIEKADDYRDHHVLVKDKNGVGG